MTITGPREALLQLRDETFSVDPEASHNEADKRMALDLNKVAPKPERMANHEALAYYLGWYAEEGGTVDEAAEFIGGDDIEWTTSAKQYPLLIDFSDAVLGNVDSEFVQIGARLLKVADPDFRAKALHQWCYENWRVQHNSCMRYGGAVIPNPEDDGTWMLQCRFDTEWLVMPIFESLVAEWPELEFRIVSCVLPEKFAMIGVSRGEEFIYHDANHFREVLANEFGYLVPSWFSMEKYGELWRRFPSTYFVPHVSDLDASLFDQVDSTEMLLTPKEVVIRPIRTLAIS